MGVTYKTNLHLNDGTQMNVEIAKSVNAVRFPEHRQKILEGTFHQFTHPTTGKKFHVDTEFFYTDFERGQFFKVSKENNVADWKFDSNAIKYDFIEDHAPELKKQIRVVYGLNELREKILLEEYDFNDTAVELFKTKLLAEHLFLTEKQNTRIYLTHTSNDYIHFMVTCGIDNDENYEIKVEVDEFENFIDAYEAQDIKKDFFDEKNNHYVGFRKLSAKEKALQSLKDFQEDLNQGKNIKLDSSEFKKMLRKLPHGNKLSSWAKKALYQISLYAENQGNESIVKDLFELRFSIKLENEWIKNENDDDINDLWSILKSLPDSHVEGNSKIDKIFVFEKYGGLYVPALDHVKLKSSLVDNSGGVGEGTGFEETLLHEVGHAVHSKYKKTVDSYLESTYKWKEYNPSLHLEDWIEAMGGWHGANAKEKRQIKRALRQRLKSGKFEAGPMPSFPDNHVWNKSGFLPRIAAEQSTDRWYRNFKKWPTHNGKAFFMNHYYGKLMSISVDAIELYDTVNGSSYMFMSPHEFFAELYSYFYNTSSNQMELFPTELANFFRSQIGRIDTVAA